jgi:aminoglycoside/choline kinase family phosphotransferase
MSNQVNREEEIKAFLARSGMAVVSRTPLPGDASTRRYERLTLSNGHGLMLMNQPVSLESPPCAPQWDNDTRKQNGWNATARLAAGRIEAFVSVANRLKSIGLSAPECLYAEPEIGLLILEDLGDHLFTHALEQEPSAPILYHSAIEVLAFIHNQGEDWTLQNHTDWPLLDYDYLALKAGADLFIEWFWQWEGRQPFSEDQLAWWHQIWDELLALTAVNGQKVMIHRDFHAENLLWLPHRSGLGRVGLLDFQDALMGHASWDLHSLLQDARRDVSEEIESSSLNHYFSLRPLVEAEPFKRDYHILAALNEVRILGVFARLIKRDHKPRYEDFMPRMWHHLGRNLKQQPHLTKLRSWFLSEGYGPKIEG